MKGEGFPELMHRKGQGSKTVIRCLKGLTAHPLCNL